MTRPRRPTDEQRAAARRLLELSRTPAFRLKVAARALAVDRRRGRERDRRDERR